MTSILELANPRLRDMEVNKKLIPPLRDVLRVR